MTSERQLLQARPLRALRYASERGSEIDRCIAPPYDVISPDHRERLASHPLNIVHIDLPQETKGSDPYLEAAKRLRSWLQDGVLIRDGRAGFYLCEQEYRAPDGTPRRRRGLFARLALEPLQGSLVIPHERTLERPRLDRQRLLEATRTHLSAVFMLHPDPGARVAGLLAELARGEPIVAARDEEGTGIRLFQLHEMSVVDHLQRLLQAPWALIADGHHRYESALGYRNARRARGARDAEHILAFLCSLEDAGLSVLPIHRVIRSVPDFAAERTRAALAAYFDLHPVASPNALGAAVRAEPRRPGVFGLLFGAGEGVFVARWKAGAGLDRPALRGIPEPLVRLDVILLHGLVLEEVLGIGPDAQARQTYVEYVKDESQLLERARGSQLGVLLNPTPIEQVVEVARAGFRLPQKTTYFYPKVPTGLVLDTLDD